MRDAYHCIASTTYSALSSTDDHIDQLARFAFGHVYTSHMVQAIYRALQSSASLGSCFWINPSGNNEVWSIIYGSNALMQPELEQATT